MYGISHAGKITQDVLIVRLASHETGTVCRHITNGVAFAFVVDDFGLKFQDLTGAEDLIRSLQLHYTLTIKMNATKFHRCRPYCSRGPPGVIPKALRRQFSPNSTAVDPSPAIYLSPALVPPLRPPTFLTLLHLSPSTNTTTFNNYYCLAVDSTGHRNRICPRSCHSALLIASSPNFEITLTTSWFSKRACDMRLHTQPDNFFSKWCVLSLS